MPLELARTWFRTIKGGSYIRGSVRTQLRGGHAPMTSTLYPPLRPMNMLPAMLFLNLTQVCLRIGVRACADAARTRTAPFAYRYRIFILHRAARAGVAGVL
ncbi:hypothetical protein EVAR_36732_1 [Eumeta japonica]|uniref:Uncharacterized protein n=1 Tax=Eumeta variegata TaxID=151549 RepID=A0A4C1X496_EUMVA|nr:hypothetical protein EVAR_36732_1 [Eumeta japonica]